MMTKHKVLVAMSGGVDSSVTAALLVKEGHEVAGITMRLWREDGNYTDEHIRDAQKICAQLGIPHHTLDLTKEFREGVVGYFMQEYAAGRTPNPCVVCNKLFKFSTLLKAAENLGYTHIATGHYVRIEAQDGEFRLRKAEALAKDQSYVLYHLNQETLGRVLFPLGGFSGKDEIRRLAGELGFELAAKPDSQDICFIPDGDYKGFLLRNAPYLEKPGDIVLENGQVIGRHAGTAFYTVGQRRGLGTAWEKPLYVKRLDMEKNQVVVAYKEDLLSDRLTSSDFSFTGKVPEAGKTLEVEAKIRYKSPASKARLIWQGNGKAEIIFEEPQNAVTAGQSVVCYTGEYVIGGGVIDS